MEQIDLQEQEKASGGLMALIVMTIIFQSLGALFGLIGWANLANPMIPTFSKIVSVISPVLNVLMLIAAIQMIKLKQKGFKLYMISKAVVILLTILSSIITFGFQVSMMKITMAQISRSMASATEGVMIAGIFIALLGKSLFPIIYLANRKKFVN